MRETPSRSLQTVNVVPLLTPWCRVLLEKLTGLQLVKKFPAFHETPRFITALTSVSHLSVSWASPIQSIRVYPHPTTCRSILLISSLPTHILQTTYRLASQGNCSKTRIVVTKVTADSIDVPGLRKKRALNFA